MMRAGVLWELTTPEPLTSATESGFVQNFPTPYGLSANQGQGDGEFGKAIRNWPTVRSSDGERGGRGDLIQAIRGNPNSHYKTYPTPTASMMTSADMEQARFAGNKGGNRPTYQEAKESFATPTKADAQGGPGRAASRTGGDNLRTQIGGQLNPTWVEWLMGWPLGWTDCAASATAKFRQWFASHGNTSNPEKS